MKRPLSHTKTKIMLVDYLAQKTIEFAQPNGGQVVVVTVGGQNAWEQGKIFYLLSRATKSGQIQRLFYIPYILQLELQHSLDTQIFILALRHYSSLITSTGRNLQEILLLYYEDNSVSDDNESDEEEDGDEDDSDVSNG